MKLWKIITVSAVLSLTSFGAFAAEESVSVTTNVDVVNIEGYAQASDVTIKVMPKDAPESDVNSLYEITEVKVTSEDGKYSYSFKMPDKFNGEDVDGYFTVYALGAKKKTDDFEYISKGKRDFFIESLNEGDLKGILSAEENERYFKAFGADISFYKTLKTDDEQDSFVLFMKTELSGGSFTEKNLSGLIKTASVLEKSKTGVDAQVLSDSGVTFEDKTIDEETDESKKAWLVKYVDDNKPYASMEKLRAAYTDAGVLYLLQTAKYTEYDGIIEKYDLLIQIKNTDYYNKYTNMSDVKKNSVNEKVKLSAATFTTYEAFRDAFSSAVGSVGSSSETGGSSSSTGGTKKSTSSSMSVSAGVANQVMNTDTKPAFGDVPSEHWASEAVSKLTEKGILSGYDDGSFKPNDSITREEFVKIIVSALGLDKTSRKSGFADVDENAWYADYIDIAVANGLISGRDETTFGVGETITREDMAVIVERALGDISSIRNYAGFDDMGEASDYAVEAIEKLYKAGIIDGFSDKEFSPKTNVTRAQAAKVIYDAFIK